MGGLTGAAPEQLEALGRPMDMAAQRLDGARDEVDSLLGQLRWQGCDADEFHGQWSQRLARAVDTAAQMLRSTATVLATNAEQQIQASADHGAGAGPSLTSDAVGVAHLAGSVLGDCGAIETLRGSDLATKLGVAGLVLDAGFIAYDVKTHSPDIDDDEVNAAIDTAGFVLAAAFPPAAIGIAIGTVVYEGAIEGAIKQFDPNLDKQIVHGVEDAAKFVGRSVVQSAELDVSAAEAVGSVVSKGVRGALPLVHL
jgi:uncharacterized protein YukE